MNREMLHKRIESLTALRFFMIMTIVISHLEFWGSQNGTKNLYDYCFHNAYIALDFFFILSGFGLTYSYIVNGRQDEMPSTWFSSIKWGYKKMKKLYWLYMLTICYSFFFALKKCIFANDFIYLKETIGKFLLCASMLQSLSGTTEISHSFNGVCWFMSCLLVLYILFPHIYRATIRIKNMRSICLILIILLVLSGAMHYFLAYISQDTQFNDLNYGHPIFRIIPFTIGIILCKLYFMMETTNHNKISSTHSEVSTIVIGGGGG